MTASIPNTSDSRHTQGKLVRDHIPELIESEGRYANYRVASTAEYHELLRDKLHEEVEEFLATGDPEELADILEVVHALGTEAGLSQSDLETMRSAKASSRGSFEKRIILYL